MSTQPDGPRRQVSIGQAGQQLPAVVEDVEQHGPVELTRRGKPVAVIVALDEYRRLAGDRPDTWTAYEKWRDGTDLDEIGIDDAFLDGIRDRSPGRHIEL